MGGEGNRVSNFGLCGIPAHLNSSKSAQETVVVVVL